MSEKLKCCPFCGGNKIEVGHIELDYDEDTPYGYGCEICSEPTI